MKVHAPLVVLLQSTLATAALFFLPQAPANAILLEYGAAVDISFATGSGSNTTTLPNETVSTASDLAGVGPPYGPLGTWAQATTGNAAPGVGMTLRANADGNEGPSQSGAAAGQIYKNNTGTTQAFTWDVELSGSVTGTAALNAFAALAVFITQPVFDSTALLDGLDLGEIGAVLLTAETVDVGILNILPTTGPSSFCAVAGPSNPSCSFGFSVQDGGSAWLLTGLLATAADAGDMASSINSLTSTLTPAAVPVPEPTALLLAAIGVLGIAGTRRRRASRMHRRVKASSAND